MPADRKSMSFGVISGAIGEAVIMALSTAAHCVFAWSMLVCSVLSAASICACSVLSQKPEMLIELSLPLVKVDGLLLAIKGEKAQEEIVAAERALPSAHRRQT